MQLRRRRKRKTVPVYRPTEFYYAKQKCISREDRAALQKEYGIEKEDEITGKIKILWPPLFRYNHDLARYRPKMSKKERIRLRKTTK